MASARDGHVGGSVRKRLEKLTESVQTFGQRSERKGGHWKKRLVEEREKGK